MSVNSKMTAIANKLRAIIYGTDKLSLDDMDSRLDMILNAVVNCWYAVTEKGGTLPNGNDVTGEGYEVYKLPDAIKSIPSGVTVQRKRGTFTTNYNGQAYVYNLGFTPDIIAIYGGFAGNYPSSVAACYEYIDGSTVSISVPSASDQYIFTVLEITRNSNGFSVSAINLALDFSQSNDVNRTFQYEAIKYT